MIFFMAKMKYWNGTTWETLDAKDADTIDGKHRRMDLSWWGEYDKNKDEWSRLVLHLERENFYSKDEETLEKLSKYSKKYTPEYRIGIIHVRNKERIKHLQRKAKKLFNSKKVLLIYRIDKEQEKEFQVNAYLMNQPNKPVIAFSKELSDTGFIYMSLKPKIM